MCEHYLKPVMDSQVDKILGHFEYKGENFYIIQWKTKFPTFHNPDDLSSGCAVLLEQYWEDMAFRDFNQERKSRAKSLKFAFDNPTLPVDTHPNKTVIPASAGNIETVGDITDVKVVQTGMDSQVENILGHFEYKNEKFYIIQWKTRFPTFQNFDDLHECPLLLEQYWEDMAFRELNQERRLWAQNLKTAFEHGTFQTHIVTPVPVSHSATTTLKEGNQLDEVKSTRDDEHQSEQACTVDLDQTDSSHEDEIENSPQTLQTTSARSGIKILSTKSLAEIKKRVPRKKSGTAKFKKFRRARLNSQNSFVVPCFLCGKYGNHKSMRDHARVMHRLTDNQCIICGLVCDSGGAFRLHFETCKRAKRKLRALLTPDQRMKPGPVSRTSQNGHGNNENQMSCMRY